jgi:hypothetical protein
MYLDHYQVMPIERVYKLSLSNDQLKTTMTRRCRTLKTFLTRPLRDRPRRPLVPFTATLNARLHLIGSTYPPEMCPVVNTNGWNSDVPCLVSGRSGVGKDP